MAAAPIERLRLRASRYGAALAGVSTSGLMFALSLDTPFVGDQEAYYALDMRSVMRGNWVMTRNKPPLYLWAGAAVSALGGGVSEISARLPEVAAAGVLAGLLFAWTARHLGQRAALVSWLALLTMGGFVTAFVTVQVDPFLVLCVYGALIALFPFASQGTSSPRRIAAAGATLGAGVLSKGPITIILVALSVGGFLLATGRNWRRFFGWPMLAAVTSALAAASIWYAAGMVADGWRFALVQYQENLGHFLPRRLGGTGEAARPFYFTLTHLVGTSMPLVLYWPAAALAAWREADRDRRDFLTYAAMPLWVTLVFFSLAAAKREVYILPALPALALLVGNLLDRMIEGDLKQRPVRFLSNAASVLLVVLAPAAAAGGAAAALAPVATGQVSGRVAAALRLHPADVVALERLLAMASSGALWATVVGAAVAAGLIASGLRRGRGWAQVAGAILFAMAGTLTWAGAVRPAVARLRTEKYFLADAMRRAPEARGSLMVPGVRDFEAEFYLDAEVPVVGAAGLSRLRGPAYLLLHRDETVPAAARELSLILDDPARPGRKRLRLVRIERSN